MALRHREMLPSAIDRENLHARQAKNLAKAVIPTRRPALDELSNKIRGATEKGLQKNKEALIKKPHAPSSRLEKENAVKSYSSRQLPTVTETIIDPDSKTKSEPQAVTEYVADIYQYLRELEEKFPIRQNFLDDHQSTSRMRAVLINWLAQVHTNFKLCLETLHLCISIIDRYLQDNKNIGRENLQLVGTSALLIACKYEEIYMPELSDFVYICDDTFSKGQILKMEIEILRKLDCSLGKPLSIHFLRRYSKIGQVRLEQHNLAKYILELALLEYELAHEKPSIQAAAACCLAMCVFSSHNVVQCPSKMWTATLKYYTSYKYSDFKDVLYFMAEMLLNAPASKHKFITSKYSESKLSKVSVNESLESALETILKTKK